MGSQSCMLHVNANRLRALQSSHICQLSQLYFPAPIHNLPNSFLWIFRGKKYPSLCTVEKHTVSASLCIGCLQLRQDAFPIPVSYTHLKYAEICFCGMNEVSYIESWMLNNINNFYSNTIIHFIIVVIVLVLLSLLFCFCCYRCCSFSYKNINVVMI